MAVNVEFYKVRDLYLVIVIEDNSIKFLHHYSDDRKAEKQLYAYKQLFNC